jgi:type VI secretion system protein ImpB
MDGKVGAEELIAKLLAEPALMRTLLAAPQGDAAERETSADAEVSDAVVKDSEAGDENR